MGYVRKTLLFVISAAMVVGGLWLLAREFLFANIIYFPFVFGGAALVFFGLYLLWEDLIKPLFRRGPQHSQRNGLASRDAAAASAGWKAFWIISRIIFGIIQLLAVIYVLSAISDANTRLIVAVLALVYLSIASGGVILGHAVLQADIAKEHRFHELMEMADPNRQAPDRQSELTIIETNWITQLFFGVISLICLFTVFGSLH